MKGTVLVVDDERVFRVMAEEALQAEDYEVRTAPTLARGRAELEQSTPDVILLDRRLPDGDGIELLKSVRADSNAPVVIVVTAYGDIENAVEALRVGATDYLTKPIQVTDLLVKLDRTLEARGVRDRLAIERSHKARPPLTEGRSAPEKQLLQTLSSVAKSPLTPVLLVGPSGAGKQCAAERLHAMTYVGSADDAPFVEVNCAALPQELIESDLFGHEKGAFTDARAKRRGFVEMANNGTLFLDEVTELSERSQAKLLKFLDTMRFRRVGGEREIEVRLRIVAATNQNLSELVESGAFRADLYHRLSVFTIAIPPLSERREDIPELARSFLEFFAGRIKKKSLRFAKSALTRLESYDYPGNVRELRNIVERAAILAVRDEVREEDVMLPKLVGAPDANQRSAFFAIDLDTRGDPPSAQSIEDGYLRRVLEHFGGKRMQAAQALGISYPTFLRRLRELGLDE